jgi:hypothetical protein
VGGRAQLFELLVGEDVDGDQVDLGVPVLAGLGGGHFDDLAGTVLDDDKAVLPQGRTLDGVGHGGTGIGALKGVLMLYTMPLVCCSMNFWTRVAPRWLGARCGGGHRNAG